MSQNSLPVTSPPTTPASTSTNSSWRPPKISHLDDILPHLEGAPHIKLFRRPSYSILDYTYSDFTLFDNPHKLECRGLKFSSDGTLLARPFHKFFNLGEGTTALLPSEHTLHTKLDGSMIHPCIIDNEVRFMTRMGITDVSLKAELLFPHILRCCRPLLSGGITPLFEYIGPSNRIVVPYPHDDLVLLAARNTIDGTYLTHDELLRISSTLGGTLVPPYQGTLEAVRHLADEEGIVIIYPSGHRIKMKADQYITRHHAISTIYSLRNSLHLILTGKIDDLYPLLPSALHDEVCHYTILLHDAITRRADDLCRATNIIPFTSQKEFALFVNGCRNPILVFFRPLLFQIRKGDDPRAALLSFALRQLPNPTSRLDLLTHLDVPPPPWTLKGASNDS